MFCIFKPLCGKCYKDAVDLNILPEIEGILTKQFNKIVKHINKELKRSLKEKPYGYAEYQLEIEDNNMRDAVMAFYKRQGYKVKENKWNEVTIKMGNWWNASERSKDE